MLAPTFELPTFEDMEYAYNLCGRELRGGDDGFQAEMFESITTPDCPYWVGQAPRQAGTKTETSALYDAVSVMKGGVVGVGMPAKSQAATVTWKRVVEYLEHFESLGLVRHKGRGTPQHLSEWETKVKGHRAVGELRLLGARKAQNQAKGETKSKNTQTGRTVHVLHLDEAQSMFEEDVEELIPAVDIAMTEGNGRVNATGVGGPEDSFIETCKSSYKSFWIDDEGVLRDCPQFAAVFADRKENRTEEFYNANYRCLPVTAGKRTMYPFMGAAATPSAISGPMISFFGIDVGRIRDYTIVAKIDWWPQWFLHGHYGHGHIDAFYQVPHVDVEDQAQLIYDWISDFPYVGGNIRTPSCIGVETNGGHWGLHDVLVKHFFPFAHKINMDETKKDRHIDGLRVKFANSQYGISDAARKLKTGDPPLRLNQLTFSIDRYGKYEYRHSDANSALVIAEHVQELVLS